ncbi:39S ribosomal protein L46, mitochondrial [Aphelenchoides besseyi]|nr:39S ribosomal protein L46, mitochondrial [Aphelenchoides besseyi]
MIISNSLCRPLTSLVRSQLAQISTRWDVAVGVAVIRPPVVAPKMSEVERLYHECALQEEHEKSLKSEFELRLIKDGELLEKRRKLEEEGKDLSQLDEQIGITAQQLEEDWIRNQEAVSQQYKLGDFSQIQVSDVRSIRQHLDRKLVLLVKQRFGEAISPWILPQLANEKETLRQTVERCLSETFDGNSNAQVDGNAPVSVYKYRYPKPLAKKLDAYGSYLFLFSAHLNTVEDELKLNGDQIHDYRWCTSDKLLTLLPSSHRNAFEMGTYFVHCNACGRLPVDKAIKYYVGNCGHIVCSKCFVGQEAKNKCIMCEKQGQKYFMDPSKMLEEILDDYDKLVKSSMEILSMESSESRKRKIVETEDAPRVRRVRFADELNNSVPSTSTPHI